MEEEVNAMMSIETVDDALVRASSLYHLLRAAKAAPSVHVSGAALQMATELVGLLSTPESYPQTTKNAHRRRRLKRRPFFDTPPVRITGGNHHD
jgi:hypothetical protein